MKNLTHLPLMILVLLSAWATVAHSQIAGGVAYRDNPQCKQYSTAVGWRWAYNAYGSASLSSLENKVEEDLENEYPGADIYTFSSQKRYMAVVRYVKSFYGETCKKTSFAFGFGNSNAEAQEDARDNARRYCSNCPMTNAGIYSW